MFGVYSIAHLHAAAARGGFVCFGVTCRLSHSNDYGGFSWKVSQRVCRGVFVGFSDCLYKLSIYCILNKTVSIGLVHVGHKDKLRQS